MTVRLLLTLIALLLTIRIGRAQSDWPPAPDALFASGIEVVDMQVIPDWVYVPPTATPAVDAAHCGYTPYTPFLTTERWHVDYAVQPDYTKATTELTLCDRRTGETRPISVRSGVRQVAIAPDARHLFILTGRHAYGYDLEAHRLHTLSTERDGYYDYQTIVWHGSAAFFLYETYMPDSDPGVHVSLGNVTVPNSLYRLGLRLKFNEVSWYTVYDSPRRTAWVSETENGCALNWLVQETGARESFDITGICAVGTPLTDDPVGPYLFMPTRTRVVEQVSAERPQGVVESVSRDLIEVNLTTGSRRTWLSGEIERLTSLDPTGRYAALILDSNGCLDLIHDDVRPDNDRCRYYDATARPSDFRAALLDTASGVLVYQHPIRTLEGATTHRFYDPMTGRLDSDFLSYSDRTGWAAGDLISLGADRFLLIRRQTSPDRPDLPLDWAADTLVMIQPDGSITETALPGQAILIGQDARYIVVQGSTRRSDDGQLRTDLLLQLESGGTVQFIEQVVVNNEYRYGVDANTSLTVSRGEQPDQVRVSLYNGDIHETAVYTIAVP